MLNPKLSYSVVVLSIRSVIWSNFSLSRSISLFVIVLATLDNTSAARVEFESFFDTVAIFFNTLSNVGVSAFVITFDSISAPAPSSLLAALNTASSTIWSNWSCPSFPKFRSSNDWLSAIDDNTCNARVEPAFVSFTFLIVSIIIIALSSLPFVIIFAKSAAPSSLLAALNTAFSINLSICTCSSFSKSTLFNDLASATEDKTCNARFAPSLFSSDISTKFTIISTVAPSDFEIILPINNMLLLLSSISSNIWV